MAEGYVVRFIEPGWEQEATAAIVGPFANGDAIAEALEKAGYQRPQADEDPLNADWSATIEVCPLIKDMPPPR